MQHLAGICEMVAQTHTHTHTYSHATLYVHIICLDATAANRAQSTHNIHTHTRYKFTIYALT